MADLVRVVKPPDAIRQIRKNCYRVREIIFETDIKYYPLKPIGRGSHGVLCAALNLDTNDKVAIKKISNVFKDPKTAVNTLRELMILRQIQHENIIALKHVMLPSQRTRFEDVYLVFELMKTSLHNYIQTRKQLFEDQIRYFIFQILCGLNYLHSVNVLHRDLRPSNILVDSNCRLKICDFGLSRATARRDSKFMNPCIGAPWYRAPELLLGNNNYGPSIDVWSIGCIFAELLGRTPIFPGSDPLNQLQRIISMLGTPGEEDLDFIQNEKARRYIKSLRYSNGTRLSSRFPKADSTGLDLLESMLLFDPNKRITAAEALNHPYMAPYFDPSTVRPAQFPVELDVEKDMEKTAIRERIWQEILHFQ
ncbi:mitogen-activated protein kinase homolog 1-like [Punica granatum]|uniref:mitogen-activated protein kinase n=2 Tax=Punica granatum TaxID=22663 RepID=A0A218W2B7_PUNGR|nr:mitogen-activated protein kinase homolog 1-like [Punica granatum]OWM66401.1 hypothetical protein CDL15_Pgr013618 [Punica granatum]PKI70003.1 hypothetical protein CRG98_009606 [Punica granatum]